MWACCQCGIPINPAGTAGMPKDNGHPDRSFRSKLLWIFEYVSDIYLPYCILYLIY